jgi:GDP-L-fucose synthase
MPTNFDGPGDNYHPDTSHVLPALICCFQEASDSAAARVTFWGTGMPLRVNLHVDDLGEVCVFALEQWNRSAHLSPCESMAEPLPVLNVGTGVDLSIRELAVAEAAATGFRGRIALGTTKLDGTPTKQLDMGRLGGLGWRARILPAEELVSTVAAFREQLGESLMRL